MLNPRSVQKILKGQETSDGAGVKLRRYIGTRELMDHDPFLMLDAFYSDDPHSYLAGFPDHPHRGFETVTYLIQGKMEHNDSRGNRGLLEPGDAQFMRAGSGIIHSEMPLMENGLMWGYQLWVNLPAKLKMSTPHYQDLQSDEIPVFENEIAATKILSGSLGGIESRTRGFSEMDYLDVTFKASGTFEIPIASEKSAFLMVIQGSGRIADTELTRGDLAILSGGDLLPLHGESNFRALVIAALPLNEPISRYGPFVMNTPQEIELAFRDYQNGKFG